MFSRPTKVPIKGAVVLITGAGSGIGRLMALGAAERGAKGVVVWAHKERDAQSVAQEIRTLYPLVAVSAFAVDVTDSQRVKDAAAATLAEQGRVDILVNNAGIVTGKEFLDITDDEVQRTLEVNTISHFKTVREFLPGMLERDRGSIVTVASAAGLVGVAKQADYNASKFGAVGFAQSLRAELRYKGSHVHTLLYCPYYISTGMFDGVKTKFPLLLPILKPEKVAKQVLDAIEAGTQMKVAPPIVRLVQLMQPFPVPFVDEVLQFFGINSTMDEFKGKKPRPA
ncbi:all-trans-retinol dehydrogenase (NAD+) [Arcanobacterium pluranimalium]|uniref:SDR family oxidoreductase n=1 Tax=Arcanobacterium pluranimalium TaxID=108028 RepID=UPI001959BCDA|nr:SDR family oxidoreductase [Arcanobacterium pluranimalium]MBM7824761.1 all-trans-retinol dehydrogenase (NAD+) [Arcanobacterium pluranimalium]